MVEMKNILNRETNVFVWRHFCGLEIKVVALVLVLKSLEILKIFYIT